MLTRDERPLAPRRFAEAIERIVRRRAASPSRVELGVSGVSLATVYDERAAVGRALAHDLRAGRLAPLPGRVYRITTDGKTRKLYDFPLVEMIVHDVIAAWLSERAAPLLSPRLFSYRPGISHYEAVHDFGRYIRQARRRQEPGLFVLRRDVRAYFDSIPTHDRAPLWRSLDPLLEVGPDHDLLQALLRRVLRPLLVDAAGHLHTAGRGIPTGSPIANVVANLYLREMDSEMVSVEGGFYARYGDDMLAAHVDAAAAAAFERTLARHFAVNELESSAHKTHDLFVTACGGRSSPFSAAAPAAAVEFLGHRIDGRGAIGLSHKKTLALLEALRGRAEHAVHGSDTPVPTRLARAARAINRLLDPDDAAAHPYSVLLRTTVTDRSYLSWLDREIALIALAAATGSRSVRLFRALPPRVLKRQYGLRSLVAARNGRRARR